MTIKTRLTTVGQVLGEQVKITTDNQLVVNLKYKVIFKTFLNYLLIKIPILKVISLLVC